MQRSPLRQIALLSVTLGMLTGCALVSNETAAPVIESTPYDIQHQDRHVVKKGDTLYTIAWRYGVDYHQLAERNHLDSPDRIVVGQVLKLDVDKKRDAIKKGDLSVKKQKLQKPLEQEKQNKREAEDKPITADKKRIIDESKTSVSLPVEKKPIVSHQLLIWDWPVKGKILKQYGLDKSQANKGIDIGGVIGKPIQAAAPGEVVYAGCGLRGYGQVIILKHDETYLSAYAHNQAILVREGDRVALGQTIAHMGQDHQQIKLHFEIRKKGKPIDPLSLLPKQKMV